jgi:hypothetical protein
MDNIGKRFLHAFFGAILGVGVGFLAAIRTRDTDNIVWYCIGGAISVAILSFFGTDYFWENLRRD